MQIPRLHVTAALAPGVIVPGTEAQAHYLASVLRRAPESELTLFNGRDGEWRAAYRPERRTAAFRVLSQRRPQSPEPDLWLLFAPLKRDATDLLAEKATELGVSRLLPTITARTIAARVNTDRLRAIAIEAAEQSERLTVPEIEAPRPLAERLATWPQDRILTVAAERRTAPPPGAHSGALLIGPEGGWTSPELDLLERYPFVTWASLGPRILRAETAAIAGLALLLAAGP